MADAASAGTVDETAADDAARRALLLTTYFIYFFCGLTLCFDNIFSPDFRVHFGLNYRELMYTKPAFALTGVVLPYLAGLLASRLGYRRCLTLAMVLFGIGNLLVVPALHYRVYSLLLAGLFVMGMGFNVELVAGNPLLAALGSAKTASSRVNLGNAMGAIAQIVPPLLVAFVIFPSDAVTVAEKVPVLEKLFLAFALVLFATAALTARLRDAPGSEPAKATDEGPDPGAGVLFAKPQVMLGLAAIFLAIGVEAGFGGLYLNYLQDAAGVPVRQSLLWQTLALTVFAIGRLASAGAQRRFAPSRVLAASVVAASLLLVGVVFGRGLVAILANTAAGFFYCSFFPTLYSLAIANLGSLTPKASGLLITGLAGVSVLPVLQGALADSVGLPASYAIGFLPWAFVLYYALRGHALSRWPWAAAR